MFVCSRHENGKCYLTKELGFISVDQELPTRERSLLFLKRLCNRDNVFAESYHHLRSLNIIPGLVVFKMYTFSLADTDQLC